MSIYEVPARLIGSRILVRHVWDTDTLGTRQKYVLYPLNFINFSYGDTLGQVRDTFETRWGTLYNLIKLFRSQNDHSMGRDVVFIYTNL